MRSRASWSWTHAVERRRRRHREATPGPMHPRPRTFAAHTGSATVTARRMIGITNATGFPPCSSTRKVLEHLDHVSIACLHPKLSRQRKVQPDCSCRHPHRRIYPDQDDAQRPPRAAPPAPCASRNTNNMRKPIEVSSLAQQSDVDRKQRECFGLD